MHCLSQLQSFVFSLPCLALRIRELLVGKPTPDEEASKPGVEVKLPVRNELGKRVRRFEKLWQVSSEEVRLRSTDSMELAVKQFFGMQLENAAQSLDSAFLSLAPDARAQMESLVPLVAIPTQTFTTRFPTVSNYESINFMPVLLRTRRVLRLQRNPVGSSLKLPFDFKLALPRNPFADFPEELSRCGGSSTLKLDLREQLAKFFRNIRTPIGKPRSLQSRMVSMSRSSRLDFQTIETAETRTEAWNRWIESSRDDSSTKADSNELATARLYNNWLRSARRCTR